MMKRLFWCLSIFVLFPAVTHAEDVTFHFHKEGNGSTQLYLLPAGPDDPTPRFAESTNIKGFPAPWSVDVPQGARYVSPAPGTRVIPARSPLTVKLWMMKTANWGVLHPNIQVWTGYANGNIAAQVCSV